MKEYASATNWQQLSDMAPCGSQLGGWMTEAEREILFGIAKNMTAGQRMVEIGVYGGPNLAMFAMLTDGVEIIGIDDFSNTTHFINNGEHLIELCHRNLKTAGIADKVDIIAESSQVIGPAWNRSIDVLITDGDHREQPAYEDLTNFGKWVNVGGYHFVDDMNLGGEVRASYARWMTDETTAGRKWEVLVQWPDGDKNKGWLLRRTA